MTLLIALMGNYLCERLTGGEFIHTGWIIAIWGLHLIAHSNDAKKVRK